MVETITVVGMVISSMAISEYDKRLVILTKELGKITAFARGARKSTSPFLAGSQPMAFGEFVMYRGRNSYTVTSIKVKEYFSNTMSEVDSMYMGMYFLELADYYGREGIESTDSLKLLYYSMRALNGKKVPNALIRCIYELKTLVINGEYPNVFTCGNCQTKDNIDYFDMKCNTVLCHNCHGPISADAQINPSTLYALQYIVASSIEQLFTFNVSENVLQEMEQIIQGYIAKRIDKKFNSLDFL